MNKLLGELSFVVHLSRTSGQVLINQNVLHNDPYSIGCVMVTMVISSLDLVYDIGIYCFSVKDAALRRKSKYWLAWNQDNISECGATGRSANCCFSGVALYKFNSACWSRTKQTSSSFHWKLICSRHNIAAKIPNWR